MFIVDEEKVSLIYTEGIAYQVVNISWLGEHLFFFVMVLFTDKHVNTVDPHITLTTTF